MPKKPVNTVTDVKNQTKELKVKRIPEDSVQRLEIQAWRSEIQQNVRNKEVSWTSVFFLSGIPADKSSQVNICRIGFFSDERSLKPSYANKEIRIYYPYSAYQSILSLITHTKKLYAEFREKANGEIDAYIFSAEQLPGSKKQKK